MAKKEKGGAFRVLVGSHIGPGPADCECEQCEVNKDHTYNSYSAYAGEYMRRRQRPPLRWHEEEDDRKEYVGDIVHTEVDLVARFNRGAGSRKFERVDV